MHPVASSGPRASTFQQFPKLLESNPEPQSAGVSLAVTRPRLES